MRETGQSPLPDVSGAGRPFAISANQRRFLLADELTDANYGLPLLYRAEGPLDVEALRASFAAVLDRHPVLRTRFGRSEAGYTASCPDRPEGWWTEVDCGGCAADEAAARTTAPLTAAFDLWGGALVRCVVGRVDAESWLIGITTHHSVSDGVSLSNLIAELSAAYAEATGGEAADLEDPPSYYELAAELWSDEIATRHGEYWAKQLAEPESASAIPRDRAGDDAQVFAKRSLDRRLPPELQARVKELAERSETSVFTVFAASLSLLLGRYVGGDDVLLGFQSSGRQGRPELRRAMGLFSTPLVLRARPRADATFLDYLRQVRADIVAALEHQRVPYDELMKTTGVRPTVDLNFYPPTPPLTLPGVEVEAAAGPEWESDFEVNVYTHPTPEGLLIRLHYAPSLFAHERMELALAQLLGLLEQVVADPERPLASYRLATDEDRRVSPDPSAPLAPLRFEPIFEQFLARAAETPEAVALEGESARWTYGELDAVSNRLAQRLIADSVGRGDAVAIVAQRDPALVLGLLGVLKAGAAFAIVDAAYPATRIADYLSQLSPAAVLTCGAPDPAWRAEGTGGATLVLDLAADPAAARAALGDAAETLPQVALDAETPAYYSFTSGSTGRAKCIQTGHAPLAHFVAWHRATFGLTAEDRFSMLSGLAHDPLLRDVFTPLACGARIVVPSEETIFDPAALVAWLAERAVTVCHITPQLGQVIASGAADLARPLALRLVCWGGDALNAAAAEALRALAPAAEQVNVYGATETPQVMAWRRVDLAAGGGPVPIGHGIDDVQILVLTPAGQLAGVGELGEICVRTRYLSTGYPFDAELTRARFVANPFTDDPGDRLYRTGDQGRYRADGEVVFAGRADDQVKIRGFRVELGEVAACIEALPDVTTAIVRPHAGPGGATQLVAYFSVRSGAAVTRAEVAEHVRRALPAYMAPTFIVAVERWPLNPNGKIDRRALPAPGADDAPRAAAHEGPQTERERELVEIWESVLGVPQVGVNESLFSLGGDSLTAIRITYRMARLGVDKQVCRAIFQGWTIREIARFEASDEAPAIQSGQTAAERSAPITITLINLVRGLLVLLIVVGHWLPGLLKRLPEAFAPIRPGLTPLFNLTTPGFAFVFGVSVGFVYFPQFQRDRSRTTRLLLNGTLLLLGAVVVLSLLRLGEGWAAGKTFTSTGVFNSYYSALTYYLLAVATAPVWLWALDRSRRPIPAALGLGLGMYVVFRLALLALEGKEFEGFVQWCKLMTVAKFNYFNMSVGALGGVALGVHLVRHAERSDLRKVGLRVGLPLALFGLALGVTTGRPAEWFEASTEIPVWKWSLYCGFLISLLPLLHPVALRMEQLQPALRLPLRLVGVVGQLALPIFLLHHLTLSAKHLFQALGLPGPVALVAALGLFALITGTLMRKVYTLYYGALVRA